MLASCAFAVALAVLSQVNQSASVIRNLPGEPTFVVVIENVTDLDQKFNAMVREVNPHARGQTNLLASVKRRVFFGEWIELDQPLAIAAYGREEATQFVYAAHVDDFETKIAEVEFATYENGIWAVNAALDSPQGAFYCRRDGEIVVGSTSRDMIVATATQVFHKSPAGSKMSQLPFPFKLYLDPSRIGNVTKDMSKDLLSMAGLFGLDSSQDSILKPIHDVVGDRIGIFYKETDYALAGLSFDRDGATASITLHVESNIEGKHSEETSGRVAGFSKLPNLRYVLAGAVDVSLMQSIDTMSSAPGTPEELRQLMSGVRVAEFGLFVSPGEFQFVSFLHCDDPNRTLALTRDYLISRGAEESSSIPQSPTGTQRTPTIEFLIGGSTGDPARCAVVPDVGGLYVHYGTSGSEFELDKKLASGTRFSDLRYVDWATKQLPARRDHTFLLDLTPLSPILSKALGLPALVESFQRPPIAASVATSGLPGNAVRIDLTVPARSLSQFYSGGENP